MVPEQAVAGVALLPVVKGPGVPSAKAGAVFLVDQPASHLRVSLIPLVSFPGFDAISCLYLFARNDAFTGGQIR